MKNPTKSYYDKNALKWDATRHNSFHHEEQFKKFIKHLRPGGQIIDIGSANGIHVPLFLGLGRKLKYEGIDISKNFVKIAKFRYPQLSFKVADIAERKTLPKKKYDGFWSAATLMHVPKNEWPKMLGNIENLMKKGAVGYITLPKKHPNPASQKDGRHFTYFTNKKFKNLISPRNWKILHSGILHGTKVKNNWLWFIVKLH